MKEEYKLEVPAIQLSDIETALESLSSLATKRAYRRALLDFHKWLQGRMINVKVLRSYRSHLVEQNMSPQNVNQRVWGIRFYLRDLAEREEIPLEAAELLCRVKTLKVKGRKLGNWLSIDEAEKLINQPDTSTPLGLRDRAILAMLIGAGLRRSEASKVEIKHFEKREDRWMLIGIRGKHGRTRNIPIADWVKALVDQWAEKAGIKTGYIFRAVYGDGDQMHVRETPLDPASLYYIVKRYGWRALQPQIAPHDLRRTFARLAFEGNAPVSQIQLALGHASQSTTEGYINAQQDLQIAPSDVLGLNIQV